MKPLGLWAFCCLLFTNLYARQDSLGQAFIHRRCHEKFISIPVDKKKKITGRFEVIDARPDTSRLGFWGEGHSNLVELLPVRTISLSGSIAGYLNASDKAGTNAARILAVIKKLWLYDTTIRSPFTEGNTGTIEQGRIALRLEAFMRTVEGLIPVTYLDTLVVLNRSVIRLTNDDQTDLLDLFMEKIAAVDGSILQRRRVFSMAAIDSINNLRYAYAIDTATVLKAGVYATVEDFRNNAPSVPDYTIEKYGKVSHLYLKDKDGQTYLSRKMWGYCDGKQCYTMLNSNLYPIIGVGHSFYVWGAKQMGTRSIPAPMVIPMPGLVVGGTASIDLLGVRDMRFFSLDLQTGAIY